MMPETDPGPFFDAAAEPALTLDGAGCVRRANAAFHALLGPDAPPLEGVPIAELTSRDDRTALLAAIADPEGGPVVASLRHAGGPAREMLWSPSRAAGGGRYVCLRDVTRERRHRDAIERMTGTGSWEAEVGGGSSVFSPMARRLFGCDPALLTREQRLAFYAQEGRVRMAEALTALEAHGRPFDLEAAFCDSRGRRRWMHVTGTAETRDGRVERVYGTIRDVTEERERRRRLERLGAVASSTTDCVVMTDADLGIEWVNEGVTRLLGLRPDDVLGGRLSTFASPDIDGDLMRTLREAVASGAGLRVEIPCRHADGRDVWLDVDLRPLPGHDGRPVGWISVGTDVSHRREAAIRLARVEREARRARERLEAAVDALDHGFVLFDADLRLVVCNRRILEMYPLQAPAAVPGTPFEDMLRYGVEHGQWPEARGREEEWIAQRLGRIREAGEPFERRLADGRWLRVVERRTPDGGRVALQIDITGQKEAAARREAAEREALQSRQQLMTAIEALDDGFTLYDREERLVLFNSRYLEIYPETAPVIVPGVPLERVMRYGLEKGQYPQAAGREEEWLADRMAEHRAGRRDMELRLPGDRWMRVKGRVTPDGGRVGLRIEITEAKRRQRDLEEARARAEAASEAKSRFLATMSHEIRTPMNGILGLVDLMASSGPSPVQGELIRDVQQAGESLLAILNDVLDFSKIEAGQMTLEAIPFDPAELASRVERLHGPSARDKGLQMRVEMQHGPHRLGDPTRLLQVLGNLASNAVKFTASGSIVVRALNPARGPLTLEVADTGIGMTEQEASCAFERFAQADGSVTRKFGGTGLGLSIVSGLATAMGGKVEVRSVPGRGTRVAVVLPLGTTVPPVVPVPARAPDADLAGLSILAADDNAANRKVLSRMLDKLGASAVIVGSGACAVTAARSERFDLLLMDISMPEMDGVEALSLIRRDEAAAERAPIPALAVTANAMADQVASYLGAGFDGHLPKPIRLAALARACRAAISEPGRAASPSAA